jgi:hypothetical protein
VAGAAVGTCDVIRAVGKVCLHALFAFATCYASVGWVASLVSVAVVCTYATVRLFVPSSRTEFLLITREDRIVNADLAEFQAPHTRRRATRNVFTSAAPP